MKSFAAILAAVVPALAAVAPRQSNSKTPPVRVEGNAFFAGNKRFYLRGVAYQPGGAADAQDPLLDIPGLKRDIANFKKLGINTVRIYTIDNSKNHDEGMKLLADAGIYLALDTNSPKYSLNRETVDFCHTSYNDVYLQNVFATIDAFAGYDNTLAFFSANEVINARNNTGTAPYIKAVTRDMKQYISNRHDRVIPVGYAAADVAENIEFQARYLDCGTDDERADFFAFNDYSWCGDSSFQKSGWDKKTETYKDYGVPIILGEFGCNTVTREWTEIEALYGEKMTPVYSGGLVYEYTYEDNKYGLVELKNGKVETNEDFDTLEAMFEKVPQPTGTGGYRKDTTASECPAEDEEWEVRSTNLPAIPEPALKFMEEGAGAGVGLEGEGSHFAGTPSSDEAESGSGEPTRVPDGSASSSDGDNEGAATSVPVQFFGMVAASVLMGFALVL